MTARTEGATTCITQDPGGYVAAGFMGISVGLGHAHTCIVPWTTPPIADQAANTRPLAPSGENLSAAEGSFLQEFLKVISLLHFSCLSWF